MIDFKKPSHLLTTLAVMLLIFMTGYNTGQKSPNGASSYSYSVKNQVNSEHRDIDFNLFWETWSALEKNYVDPKKLDPQKMYLGAIRGMVASLEDPYTFFLSPSENQETKDDLGGKFEGIGAELGLKNGGIIVVSPIHGSPAEKAGLKTGDYVIKVNGTSTENWTLVKAVQNIRGEKGTEVKLTLLRKSKELDLKIKRDTIKVSSTELTMKGTTAILKLSKFGDNTDSEWDKEIDKIVDGYKKGTINGMVLDMRNNPGGFLQSAVYVSSEFLPEGAVVVNQEYNKDDTEVHKVTRMGRLKDIPLVVLVNGGSASASEIVAGALRDHKRAKLVGEKTFGKGSVQIALDLKGKAGVHVTVAKWKLPNGDWIHMKGIEPDVKVENKI
ncbi:MAG: S41 family peptidase, partial [Candidatus Roizmanbacteria bacterium]